MASLFHIINGLHYGIGFSFSPRPEFLLANFCRSGGLGCNQATLTADTCNHDTQHSSSKNLRWSVTEKFLRLSLTDGIPLNKFSTIILSTSACIPECLLTPVASYITMRLNPKHTGKKRVCHVVTQHHRRRQRRVRRRHPPRSKHNPQISFPFHFKIGPNHPTN